MILESAYLHIKQGKTDGFGVAFKEASAIISAMDGYISHELHQCMEDDHLYLLLVQWETLEAHTEGFRGSEEYQQWKKLLHHFYEPFPTVYHFEEVNLG
ncbi:MAG: antibiotic biosynthesis monooxygenase [Chloroflexota bacterium]